MQAEPSFTGPLRRLPLAGAQNTRDLGGYLCAGGATRWGVFVRSDNLHELTPEDLQMLQAYGIENTLDLRSEPERLAQPSLLAACEGVRAESASLSDRLAGEDYEGDTPGSMAGLYMDLLDTAGAEIAKAIRFLADTTGGTVFHCYHGKDRTGLIAMFLLCIAGVAPVEIVADYAVSEIFMHDKIEKQMAMYRKENPNSNFFGPGLNHRIRSVPGSMWRALRHLREEYATPENYLLQAGVPQADLVAIRQKFVTM